MSGVRIAITGPALRCGIVAALLSRQWAGLGREIVVDAHWAAEDGEVLLRPGFARFHGEIDFNAVGHTSCRPALAYDVEVGDDRVALPLTPFGVATRGVAFHHFWLRAANMGEGRPLSDYSLALRLHQAGKALDGALIERLQIDSGLWVACNAYARALLEHAGVREVATTDSCEIVIDCDAREGGWVGNVIAICADGSIPGLEWLTSVNAARRIAKLAANLDRAGPAQREYNRLTDHEAERVSDMRVLLCGDSPAPSLNRKIALFEACGRIPLEDHEVFTQHEWLAALWATGHRPARYDRMGDIAPEAELKRWLNELGAQIEQISAQAIPS